MNIQEAKEEIIRTVRAYLEKDEDCDLDCTPNKAVSCEITTAASTSLGFGGHNACVAFKKID